MPNTTNLTRRRFLQAAGTAAVAVPTILPATVFGRENSAPSERITVGFIGVGIMNRGHLGRFLSYPDVQVLAVCDVDTTRREHALKMVNDKYGEQIKNGEAKACDAYVDFRELLARKDIDAVVIATPDHWHAIQAIEAVKAGKDIYCEKPLSLTIGEAKRMIDVVREHKRVFQTGSQQRTEFAGYFRSACELVRSGRVGKVLTIHVGVGSPSKWCDLPEEPTEPGLDWDRWLGPAPMRPYNSVLSPRGIHNHFPAWRNYREYSGGLMTDMGAHHFDIAQWALNMDASGPVEIVPPADLLTPRSSEERGRGDGDYRGAKLIYSNGVEVIHGGPSGLTIVGTSGMISVDRDHLSSVPDKIAKDPLGEKDVHLPQFPGHHRNWLDCIRTREKPICDVEIGARSVTVCHLANLAYWNGRRLRWDPKQWQFLDDAEANTWLDRPKREPWNVG